MTPIPCSICHKEHRDRAGSPECVTNLQNTIDTLTAENSGLKADIAASAGLKCPNPDCGDQGFQAIQVTDDDWEQEQCEFCYTVKDSVYMRNAASTEQKCTHRESVIVGTFCVDCGEQVTASTRQNK